MKKQLDKALESLPAAAGDEDPEVVLDDQNDEVNAEFGVRPAAERKAARDASRGAAGTKRPDIA